MSELKIVVSDNVKKQKLVEEMRNFLNSLPPPEIKRGDFDWKGENSKSHSYYVEILEDRAHISREVEYEKERATYSRVKGLFFYHKVLKTETVKDFTFVYVAHIDFKTQTITCESEKDFDNMRQLAEYFSFKKLVKNWRGAI